MDVDMAMGVSYLGFTSIFMAAWTKCVHQLGVSANFGRGRPDNTPLPDPNRQNPDKTYVRLGLRVGVGLTTVDRPKRFAGCTCHRFKEDHATNVPISPQAYLFPSQSFLFSSSLMSITHPLSLSYARPSHVATAMGVALHPSHVAGR